MTENILNSSDVMKSATYFQYNKSIYIEVLCNTNITNVGRLAQSV